MRHAVGLVDFLVGALWGTLLATLLAPEPLRRADEVLILGVSAGGAVGVLVGWLVRRLWRAIRGE